MRFVSLGSFENTSFLNKAGRLALSCDVWWMEDANPSECQEFTVQLQTEYMSKVCHLPQTCSLKMKLTVCWFYIKSQKFLK